MKAGGLLLLLLTVAPAFSAGMPPERQREVLRDALNAFDNAVAKAQANPTQSQELYRRAAAGFEALVAAGLNNPALEYNLGNTYFRLSQLGQAVVHYRRAERLEPRDEKLQANLAYVRRQVEPLIERSGEERLWRRLLFWHYGFSLRQRFEVAAILSGVGWMLLILRLRWRRRALVAAGIAAVVLSVACGASVVWTAQEDVQNPPAVVTAHDVVLRLGRGEGYDPALKQPLGPGVELRILQQRGDWLEVRLPNDQSGWLPAATVERV